MALHALSPAKLWATLGNESGNSLLRVITPRFYLNEDIWRVERLESRR
jgi:hypothetical protein